MAAIKSGDLSFGPDDSSVIVHCVKGKNDQYRHGSKVTIVASGNELVCLVRLIRRLMVFSPQLAKKFLFQGFDGRLVRRAASDTRPSGSTLSFSQ